ncbi:MAG: hypothetical protein KAJ69_01150 [Thermoplasmatales archaeon]|jgi:uncharacterized membrane protein|nr:hypothetical protein [Thermoplasmatales archaeon]
MNIYKLGYLGFAGYFGYLGYLFGVQFYYLFVFFLLFLFFLYPERQARKENQSKPRWDEHKAFVRYKNE